MANKVPSVNDKSNEVTYEQIVSLNIGLRDHIRRLNEQKEHMFMRMTSCCHCTICTKHLPFEIKQKLQRKTNYIEKRDSKIYETTTATRIVTTDKPNSIFSSTTCYEKSYTVGISHEHAVNESIANKLTGRSRNESASFRFATTLRDKTVSQQGSDRYCKLDKGSQQYMCVSENKTAMGEKEAELQQLKSELESNGALIQTLLQELEMHKNKKILKYIKIIAD